MASASQAANSADAASAAAAKSVDDTPARSALDGLSDGHEVTTFCKKRWTADGAELTSLLADALLYVRLSARELGDIDRESGQLSMPNSGWMSAGAPSIGKGGGKGRGGSSSRSTSSGRGRGGSAPESVEVRVGRSTRSQQWLHDHVEWIVPDVLNVPIDDGSLGGPFEHHLFVYDPTAFIGDYSLVSSTRVFPYLSARLSAEGGVTHVDVQRNASTHQRPWARDSINRVVVETRPIEDALSKLGERGKAVCWREWVALESRWRDLDELSEEQLKVAEALGKAVAAVAIAVGAFCVAADDALAAIDSAIASLGSDAYGKQLAAWRKKLAAIDYSQRPPQAPDYDARKGSEEQRALRKAVRDEARKQRAALHARWLSVNDRRKAQERAARDAKRDWKHEQQDRSYEANQRRAARSWLARAREQPLHRVLPGDVVRLAKLTDVSFETSDIDAKAKLQDELVQLWSRMLCHSVPASWAFSACELSDDGLGECHIGSFRQPPESVSAFDWHVEEQAWTGGSLALWLEDVVLCVTFEHGSFGRNYQLITGASYSFAFNLFAAADAVEAQPREQETPAWMIDLLCCDPMAYERSRRLQEAAARGGAYSRSAATGNVDIYVGGELQLTESFISSWYNDGRPSTSSQLEDRCRRELEDRWSQEGYTHRRLNLETGDLEIDSDAEDNEVRLAVAKQQRVV